jgi:CheY-like chemotaxis protein
VRIRSVIAWFLRLDVDGLTIDPPRRLAIKARPRSEDPHGRVRPDGVPTRSVRALMARAGSGGKMRLMRRILIVDDHAAFRAAARQLLQRGGFDVVGEAADGDDAVAAVARLRPQIVLLDVQLPGDDGFRTCERILDLTEEAVGGPLPLIVLTSGRSISTFRRRLAASRAAGFIGKADLTAGGLSALIGGVT